MMLFPFSSTLPILAVFIVISLAITLLLIMIIWTVQFKDDRRHYALSFMLFWLMLGCIIDIFSQLLLEPATFPFSLFNMSGASINITSTAAVISPTGSTSFNNTYAPLKYTAGVNQLINTQALSGLTAMFLAGNVVRKSTDQAQHLASMQMCILFAHLNEIRWAATCISLVQWDLYIYRCLTRKLGVVNPRLMATIAENDPSGHPGHAEANAEAGFGFQRSFSSLADWWLLIPVFIVGPILVLGVVIKTAMKSLFSCCFRVEEDTPINEQLRKDVFENWPKCSTHQEYDSVAIANMQIDHVQHPPLSVASDISMINADIATSSINSVLPPSSLAAKLGVDRLDLNETREENYSYDIMGNKIKYYKDSWARKLSARIYAYKQVAWDIIVCLVLPTFAFLLLFFIPLEGRSYEVYPGRGGCRVSRTQGSPDWESSLILDVMTTATALLGLVLTAVAIKHFRKQHGTFNIDIKSLTPSPDVLRLYNSTKVVRHFLTLCFCLNAILSLAQVASLGLFGFHSTSALPSPSLIGNKTNAALFRLAQNDRDLYQVAITFLLVIIPFAFLLWSRLHKWVKAIDHWFSSTPEEKEEEEVQEDDDEDVTPFPFPFHSNLSRDSDCLARRERIRCSDSATCVIDMPPADKNDGSPSSTKPSFTSDRHRGYYSSDFESRTLLGSLRGYLTDSQRASPCSSANISIVACSTLRPIQEHSYDDIELGPMSVHEFTSLAVGSPHNIQGNAIQLPPRVLTPSREGYSSSWLPSVPVHGHTLPKTLHGGKMMGQYLQLSRMTPTFTPQASSSTSLPASGLDKARRPDTRQTTSSLYDLGASPLSDASLSKVGRNSTDMFASRKAIEDYVRKVNETTRVGDTRHHSCPLSTLPDLQLAQNPYQVNDVVTDSGRHVTESPFTIICDLQTRAASPIDQTKISSSTFGSSASMPRALYSRRRSSSTSSSSSRTRDSASGSKSGSRSSSRTPIDQVRNQGSASSSLHEPHQRLEYQRYSRALEQIFTKTRNSSDKEDDTSNESETGVGYDRVIKKLVKSKMIASAAMSKKVIVYHRESRIGFDNEVEDDGDECCETETMGAISLEGLVCDDLRVRHDSIQDATTMPMDDRAMLQSVVHHALQSGRRSSVASTVSIDRGPSGYMSSSRRGQRRGYTVKYANRDAYMSFMSQTYRASREPRIAGPYFSTSKQSRPLSNIYGDDEEDCDRRQTNTTLDKLKTTSLGSSSSSSLQHFKKQCRRGKLHPDAISRVSKRSERRAAPVILVPSGPLEYEPARPDSPMMPPSAPLEFQESVELLDVLPAPESVGGSNLNRGSSLLPGITAEVQAEFLEVKEEGEMMVYSARLDRMICLPKGVRPVNTPSIVMGRKASQEVEASGTRDKDGLIHDTLWIGPLPPAPIAAPPTPPAGVLSDNQS